MTDNLADKSEPTKTAPADNGNTAVKAAADEFSKSLVFEVDPWYESFIQNIRDLVHPKKLPPLKLTSKPVAVKEMWEKDEYSKVARPTSVLIHGLIVALLLIPVGKQVAEVVKKEVIYMPVDVSPYVPQLPPAEQRVQGGGGGGDRSPIPASLGKLPKLSMKQLAPPEVVVRNPDPKLAVDPSVIVPPQIQLPSSTIARLGDPLGELGMPSNGPGFGGGIGSGSGGGVGSGKGPGVGPGEGGGIGGGVFRVGGGVSAPQIVFKVDPEYSEQARKAKYQGTVVLNLVVQKDGSVRDVKVLQPLGLGLDEKAIEAVMQWRFKPGMRQGKAVDVSAIVEVTFRLL